MTTGIERLQATFTGLAREPGRLIEPGVWLALCAAFIAAMEATGDNSFGYFSQDKGHSLFWPLAVGGIINAATFYANAFALMPRYLERRAVGTYLVWALGLWAASAVAQSVGQSVIIALGEPSLRNVGFVDLTLMNLATAPFVILFSGIYKVARDWAPHVRERVLLNERIMHLSRELDASHRELRDQAAGPGRMIRLESGKEQFQIPLADIHYVKAASNYVEIFTSARRYLVYGQLKNIEPLLPKPRFVRVHRSHIVALDRIRVANGTTLTLEDAELAVGPAYEEAFREAWAAWTAPSKSRA